MQVHLERSGQQFGPYSIEEVHTYLSSGQVVPTDMAWYDGAPGWMPLTQVPGVQVGGPPSAPSVPPPTPDSAPSVEGIEEKKEEAAPTVSAEALAAARKMDELPEDLKDRQIATGILVSLMGGFFFVRNPLLSFLVQRWLFR